MLLTLTTVRAADDYKGTKEYLTLRDSMHHAFNDGDSARFFYAVKELEFYLLDKGDLHAYYTQRCNEIVFQLNRERIFEAYKLATQLSKELAERKLDKEMYMAINMMGHIYRFSGNKESAKGCFWDVIRRMEKEGYRESLPPIYMNLVNIYMDEDPKEALRLLEKAVSIASETSPERVFDIEVRRSLIYYSMGDKERFLKGYQAYKEGVSKGLSSVHGRSMEVYYLACQGQTDKAVHLAQEELDDGLSASADILAKAGRWQEAYDMLRRDMAETDSVNSVILSSSMQGIQQELHLYETERQSARRMLYALVAIVTLLALLVVALVYIVQSRRRHLREMGAAYEKVLASDKMKTEFMQNVSHEVRTPLNIISGYAQVLADSSYELTPEERQQMASTVMHNTHVVTTMINEVLEIADSEKLVREDTASLPFNEALRRIVEAARHTLARTDQTLRMETTIGDEYCVDIPEHLLARTINPLLDNAVKYSPDGVVVLRTSLENDGHLLLAVEDSGCGIPAEEAEHIFERFVKLDTFKEGLGLGLPFSRTTAQRLGGDVWLDTTYAGPGARFMVRL